MLFASSLSLKSSSSSSSSSSWWKVSRHDEGIYQCSAGNGVGERAVSQIHLRVLCKFFFFYPVFKFEFEFYVSPIPSTSWCFWLSWPWPWRPGSDTIALIFSQIHLRVLCKAIVINIMMILIIIVINIMIESKIRCNEINSQSDLPLGPLWVHYYHQNNDDHDDKTKDIPVNWSWL